LSGELVPIGDDNPFVDNEAIKEVIEKAEDALRPLGLTVIPDSVHGVIDHKGQRMILNFSAVVRPSAKKQVEEDRAAREEFNQMMAKQHEAMIEDKLANIRRIMSGKSDDWFGAGEHECSHERRHPDGFCLDCGQGMEP
jgi:hypothetical protein